MLLLSINFLSGPCNEKTTSTEPSVIVAKPRSIWATEWSKDGKYIAVGGDDSTVWIYRGSDYRFYKRFQFPGEVKNFNWHPKENLLAVASSRGAHLLNLETDSISAFREIKVGGRAIGWNYNGELLALADGRGVVQVMDKTGKHLRSIPKHNSKTYMTLDWHPFKNIILTASDEILLFDTSGKQLAFIKHRPESVGVLTARWHPSGEFFATGDYGHENEGKPTLLQFWNADGTLIKQMLGHHREIRNLKWNKDGSLLVTGSDGIRIWNKNGELVKEASSDETVWGLSWNKENDKIAAGTYNGSVSIWSSKARLIKKIN